MGNRWTDRSFKLLMVHNASTHARFSIAQTNILGLQCATVSGAAFVSTGPEIIMAKLWAMSFRSIGYLAVFCYQTLQRRGHFAISFFLARASARENGQPVNSRCVRVVCNDEGHR